VSRGIEADGVGADRRPGEFRRGEVDRVRSERDGVVTERVAQPRVLSESRAERVGALSDDRASRVQTRASVAGQRSSYDAGFRRGHRDGVGAAYSRYHGHGGHHKHHGHHGHHGHDDHWSFSFFFGSGYYYRPYYPVYYSSYYYPSYSYCPPVYYYEPVVYYPAPVVYAPPPVYYYPRSGFSFGVSWFGHF
jgi:hypothetical protein